ncbi:hypothetical protein ACFL1H_07360, partial [Nanoarchaeota archaeon]
FKVLNHDEVDRLRGYLLNQRLLKGNKIDSPLLHANNCQVIHDIYGIEKISECPIDNNTKMYISPRGEIKQCEFIKTMRGK